MDYEVKPRREIRSAAARLLFLPVGLALLFAPDATAADNFPKQESVSLFQILTFGPEINLTLSLMFFLAVFLFLYSLMTTRRRIVMPYDLIRMTQDYVAAGNIEQAINLLQSRDTLFSRTVLPGLKLHSHSHDRITASMEAAGRRALGGFRQTISYISNLATLAPMLGLLGTVLGLTKAFNVMGSESPLGMRDTLMTAYIGEAMGTTVVGLLVGIPAMAAYYLCLSRLGRLGDDLEAVTEEIAVALAENNRSAGVPEGLLNLTAGTVAEPLHRPDSRNAPGIISRLDIPPENTGSVEE